MREIFIRAKALIENGKWYPGEKDQLKANDPKCNCAFTAIYRATGRNKEQSDLSCKVFEKLNGIFPKDHIPKWNIVFWNDTPGRTKNEVLAAFDRAIEGSTV